MRLENLNMCCNVCKPIIHVFIQTFARNSYGCITVCIGLIWNRLEGTLLVKTDHSLDCGSDKQMFCLFMLWTVQISPVLKTLLKTVVVSCPTE